MCHLDGRNHADPSEDCSSTNRYDIGSSQNNPYSQSQSRYSSERNDNYGG